MTALLTAEPTAGVLAEPTAGVLAEPTAVDPAELAAADHLATLAPISLAELGKCGELLTRVDGKYVVPRTDLPRFLEALAGRTEAPGRGPRVLSIGDRRQSSYESVYYDTPSLTSYLQAARKRPRRFKVRTRAYLDSGQAFLEVKTRDGRRRTVKNRMDMPADARWGRELDPLAQSFVAGHLDRAVQRPDEVSWQLARTLSTRYRRTTLFLPTDVARVTIDLDLRACNRQGATLAAPSVAIVETKTDGRACAADRALWRLGIRPVRVSKYGTSLAALDPDLPAHKWRPALRQLGARILPTQ
jgi:VTC domain